MLQRLQKSRRNSDIILKFSFLNLKHNNNKYFLKTKTGKHNCKHFSKVIVEM